jgi:hypothetical protein
VRQRITLLENNFDRDANSVVSLFINRVAPDAAHARKKRKSKKISQQGTHSAGGIAGATHSPDTNGSLAGDILRGAQQISESLGIATVESTHYLQPRATRPHPAFRHGAIICAGQSILLSGLSFRKDGLPRHAAGTS